MAKKKRKTRKELKREKDMWAARYDEAMRLDAQERQLKRRIVELETELEAANITIEAIRDNLFELITGRIADWLNSQGESFTGYPPGIYQPTVEEYEAHYKGDRDTCPQGLTRYVKVRLPSIRPEFPIYPEDYDWPEGSIVDEPETWYDRHNTDVSGVDTEQGSISDCPNCLSVEDMEDEEENQALFDVDSEGRLTIKNTAMMSNAQFEEMLAELERLRAENAELKEQLNANQERD